MCEYKSTPTFKYGLGGIQVLHNAIGIRYSTDQLSEGVWSNDISVTRVLQFPEEKHCVTLEWPLIKIMCFIATSLSGLIPLLHCYPHVVNVWGMVDIFDDAFVVFQEVSDRLQKKKPPNILGIKKGVNYQIHPTLFRQPQLKSLYGTPLHQFMNSRPAGSNAFGCLCKTLIEMEDFI